MSVGSVGFSQSFTLHTEVEQSTIASSHWGMLFRTHARTVCSHPHVSDSVAGEKRKRDKVRGGDCGCMRERHTEAAFRLATRVCTQTRGATVARSKIQHTNTASGDQTAADEKCGGATIAHPGGAHQRRFRRFGTRHTPDDAARATQHPIVRAGWRVMAPNSHRGEAASAPRCMRVHAKRTVVEA